MQELFGYNPQSDEFGKTAQESAATQEAKAAQECSMTQEQMRAQEQNRNDSPPPKPPSKQTAKRFSSLLLAALSTLTVGTATLPALQSGQSQASLLSLDAKGTAIHYRVDAGADEDLAVTLKNDCTDRRIELDAGENQGQFDNLVAGMTYTFSVVDPSVLGDVTISKRQITIPDPAIKTAATLADYRTGAGTLSVILDIDGYADCQAVLQKGEEIHTKPLQNGRNTIAFDSLVRGEAYTLTVEAKGIFRTEILLTQQIIIPPPQHIVCNAIEMGADGNAIYAWLYDVQSNVPLQAILTADGEQYTRPVQNGENELIFEGLTEGKDYTLTVAWVQENHFEVVAVRGLYLPHPLEYSYVELLELGQDGVNLHYQFLIDAVVPVWITLEGEGESYRHEVDPLTDCVGTFENLTVGKTYTISVVGEGRNGEQAVFSQDVTVQDPSTL